MSKIPELHCDIFKQLTQATKKPVLFSFKNTTMPFTWEVLSPKDLYPTLELLAKTYCDETMAKALDVTYLEAKAYITVLCERSMVTGTTVVIKNSSTGELVGGMIAEDLAALFCNNRILSNLGKNL